MNSETENALLSDVRENELLSVTSGENFIGWIPNISGRLSFGSLTSWRNTLDPKQVSAQDTLSSDRPRKIIAHHQRITNDGFFSILGRSFTQFMRPVSLRFSRRIFRCGLVICDSFDYFLVLNSSGQNNFVEGYAFALNSPRAERSVRREWVKEFRRAIKTASKFNRGLESNFPHQTLANQDLTALLNKITGSKKSSVLYAKLKIDRCGTCNITNPRIVCGKKLTEGDAWESNGEAQANQLYRFVRDVFHSHYHHHWAEDSLTAVTLDDGSMRWVENSHRQIYRALISCRRAGTDQGLAQAAGHLSYLKSLTSIYRDQLNPNFRSRDLDALESSILSAQQGDAAQKNARRIAITALAVLPFAVLTFGVSLTRTVAEDSSHSELKNIFVEMYDLVSGNLELAILALLAVGCLYYRLFRAEKFINVGVIQEAHRAIRSWSEGGQSRAKHRAPRILTVLGFLLLGTLFFILSSWFYFIKIMN